MASGQEAIDILRSIDSTLKALLVMVKPLVQEAKKAQPKLVASDRDLDSKYGDPKVLFMPRDWTGPTYKGRRFSECPPELLEMLAETFDYFGDQAEASNEMTNSGKPVAPYKRRDAGRARGWAQRIRSGRHVQTSGPTQTAGWADGESGGEGWADHEPEPDDSWA